MTYCSLLEEGKKKKKSREKGPTGFNPVYFKLIVIGNILVKLVSRLKKTKKKKKKATTTTKNQKHR